VRWANGGGGGSLTSGENPLGGAFIDYYLKTAPTTILTLDFLDAAGKVIRGYTSEKVETDSAKKIAADSIARKMRSALKSRIVYEAGDSIVPAREGTNRFVWNLRYPGAKKLTNTLIDEGTLDGPVAPPGNYSVRLVLGKDTLVKQFTVVADPRVKTTTAELVQQFELALKVRDRITAVTEAAMRIEDIQSQIDQRTTQTAEQAYAKRVADAAKPLRGKFETVRADVYEIGCHVDQCSLDQPMKLYNILITIAGQVQTGDYAPTKQHVEMYADFAAKVGDQLRKLQQLEDSDLAAFNSLLKELNVPAVFVPPRKIIAM
jgi:hypothetical protein